MRIKLFTLFVCVALSSIYVSAQGNTSVVITQTAKPGHFAITVNGKAPVMDPGQAQSILLTVPQHAGISFKLSAAARSTAALQLKQGPAPLATVSSGTGKTSVSYAIPQ